jgi:hypothetical protein
MNDSANNCTPQTRPWLFKPGESGNPAGGRKGPLGRGRALMVLDTMLADETNLAKLREALQVYFDKSPVRFFRQIIMPLMPRDLTLKFGEEGVVQWTSILQAFPVAPQGDASRPSTALTKPAEKTLHLDGGSKVL